MGATVAIDAPAAATAVALERTATLGWARLHDRRVHAAGVARRLQPVAAPFDGFASSRLRVRLPGARERRPAAALVAAPAPVDGIVTEPPLLVVEYEPGDPAWWLTAGAAEVWVVSAFAVVVWKPGSPPVARARGEDVPVPGLEAVALPAAALLAPW